MHKIQEKSRMKTISEYLINFYSKVMFRFFLLSAFCSAILLQIKMLRHLNLLPSTFDTQWQFYRATLLLSSKCMRKNSIHRTANTLCVNWKRINCFLSHETTKSGSMAASVTKGSSFSEDQFGKKVDRCLTDTLVKAGTYNF